MTRPNQATYPALSANPPAAFDDRCDFILFLQRRLHVNRRQARTLLSAWMQEFTPSERTTQVAARGRS